MTSDTCLLAVRWSRLSVTRKGTVMTLTKLDHEMIAVAKRRGIVRLDTGMLATLVSWGTCGKGRPSNNRVRLEGADGETRWTAYKREIIAVVE